MFSTGEPVRKNHSFGGRCGGFRLESGTPYKLLVQQRKLDLMRLVQLRRMLDLMRPRTIAAAAVDLNQ